MKTITIEEVKSLLRETKKKWYEPTYLFLDITYNIDVEGFTGIGSARLWDDSFTPYTNTKPIIQSFERDKNPDFEEMAKEIADDLNDRLAHNTIRYEICEDRGEIRTTEELTTEDIIFDYEERQTCHEPYEKASFTDKEEALEYFVKNYYTQTFQYPTYTAYSISMLYTMEYDENGELIQELDRIYKELDK